MGIRTVVGGGWIEWDSETGGTRISVWVGYLEDGGQSGTVREGERVRGGGVRCRFQDYVWVWYQENGGGWLEWDREEGRRWRGGWGGWVGGNSGGGGRGWVGGVGGGTLGVVGGGGGGHKN